METLPEGSMQTILSRQDYTGMNGKLAVQGEKGKETS
jgi:hypothetical protein